VWTATGWIEVASAVIVFGGLRLFRIIRKRKADSIKPAFSYADVLFSGFIGLEFGLLIAFGWQAFHRPLIFLTVLAFVGCVLAGLRPDKSSQRSPRQVL
jgi:hypothetical protein